MIKYFHFLYEKMKKYDKNATNPFYNKKLNTPITDMTYVWVEKKEDTFQVSSFSFIHLNFFILYTTLELVIIDAKNKAKARPNQKPSSTIPFLNAK